MASLLQNLTPTLAILILCASTSAWGMKSKYSKDVNLKATPSPSKTDITQRMETKNPFRMQKFNTFWEKVMSTSHLEGDRKTQLFMELTTHDQGEIELKHLKADGGDADGEIEAKLRHSFIDIMKKFDLRSFLTPELKTQFAKSEEKNHFDAKIKADNKEQTKKLKTRASSADSDLVASLVKQAKESDDFDAEEMRDLEEEMRHFTERKEERDLLLGNEDDEWKHHEDKWTKKQKMGKSKKVDDYGNLDDQLTDQKKSGKLEGFHHPRVLKLWETAQRSNFTKEELVELKEELQHFEVKLMKHETVHEQASILKSEANADGGNLLREVEDKRDEMARGVKKMETYLEQKIMTTKMEL